MAQLYGSWRSVYIWHLHEYPGSVSIQLEDMSRAISINIKTCKAVFIKTIPRGI